MAHVVVLGLVLTLAAGVVSFAVLARKLGARPSRLPRSLPAPLLLYNLWIAGWLAEQYVGFYLYPSLERPVAGLTAAVFRLLLSLVALAWLAAHAVTADQFLESAASRRARRAAVRGSLALAALLAASWLPGLLVPAARPFYRAADGVVSTLLFPAALAIGAVLAIGARREPDAGARHALRALGYSYVVLFALLTALSVMWQWRALPGPVLLSTDLALELAYNVLTVAWVLRYGDAFAAPAPHLFQPGRGFDELCEALKISRREREIVELICLGLTNQQIADRLFISIGTVKDHNYTIFQKAGVKNRTQLAQLFSRPGGPAAAAPAGTIRRVV